MDNVNSGINYGYIMVICIAALFAACSNSTDPYKPFVKNNREQIYPQKSDSIQVLPGKNRVILKIAKPVDPHVKKEKVLWNNGQDSTQKKFTAAEDTLLIEIDSLQTEGAYTFNIYTLDDSGNQSIGQTVANKVYGEAYRNTLYNRRTKGVGLDLKNNSIVINWLTSPQGATGSMLTYTDTTGAEKTIFVANDSSETEISDLKGNDLNTLEYQTGFKPDTTVIDTFYAEKQGLELQNIFLQNSEKPFENAGKTYQKFATPADWIVNDAARNVNGDIGGIGGYPGNSWLGLATYCGCSDKVENGKIYKTATLPAGNYSFQVNFKVVNGNYPSYLVAAKGDSLPNIVDLDNKALAYADFDQEQVDFQLAASTKISFGFLVTIQTGANFFVNSVKLNYSP